MWPHLTIHTSNSTPVHPQQLSHNAWWRAADNTSVIEDLFTVSDTVTLFATSVNVSRNLFLKGFEFEIIANLAKIEH